MTHEDGTIMDTGQAEDRALYLETWTAEERELLDEIAGMRGSLDAEIDDTRIHLRRIVRMIFDQEEGKTFDAEISLLDLYKLHAQYLKKIAQLEQTNTYLKQTTTEDFGQLPVAGSL